MGQAKVTLVGVEAIIPGMVLAEEVRDRKGRLLAGNGTLLSVKLQRQMRLWGVEIVSVERASAPEIPTRLAEPVEASSTLSELLQIDERDPFMQELARFAQHLYERRKKAERRPKEGSRR